MTDFSRLDDWGDLLLLTGQVNYDHLLVIIRCPSWFYLL